MQFWMCVCVKVRGGSNVTRLSAPVRDSPPGENATFCIRACVSEAEGVCSGFISPCVSGGMWEWERGPWGRPRRRINQWGSGRVMKMKNTRKVANHLVEEGKSQLCLQPSWTRKQALSGPLWPIKQPGCHSNARWLQMLSKEKHLLRITGTIQLWPFYLDFPNFFWGIYGNILLVLINMTWRNVSCISTSAA